MNYSQHFLSFKRRTFPLLLVALLVNGLPATPAVVAYASLREKSNVEESGARNTKHAHSKVSSELLDAAQRSSRKPNERLKVIVQLNDKGNTAFDLFLQSYGARTTRSFSKLNARAVELPAHAIKALAARGELRFVSPDQETIPAGHVSETTGADAVRNALGVNTLNLPGGAPTYLDGTGIGIAVLDSGIDLGHRAFLNQNNKSRVVLSRDFTGENRIDDPYGHGTHVASIAAGNGRISNAEYIGIAPNANIINLRVLNSKGQGTTSALLASLDWVLANRALYNIRVVNLSLGAPAIESYRNDPVCRAVRRLVDAGVVVLAAAGNNGKNSSGQKIYGQIHSPGNDPSALTVGAANTFGSHPRGDDGVASYSSRGPTRSFWTDALGTKRYDSLIKPDIVAPGNKLVYAQADDNLLVRLNPELDAGVSPVDNRKMMFMNGSSMATPVAAGAAALLLQVNPKLTPNLVKMILMYTAQPLAGFNMFEQGAGQLNIEGAVRLAKVVRTDLSPYSSAGAPLLTSA
ncbi:MAG TPA: S8 family peptidase, partial [Pyrinomonadaceae bacterium]|nr:S8 family peptidase [Pyrinomonadaceae bacterium]